MSVPGEGDDLPFEEQSNIIFPKTGTEKNDGDTKNEKQDLTETKTEKKDKKSSRKSKNDSDSTNKKSESNEKTENAQDSIPFSEILKQNQFKEFMKEAEKKSTEMKSKILSQLNEVFKIFDIDHDGIISENDLRYTFTTLGESISDEKIKKMLDESSKPLDFNAFIGLFEDKEMEFDSQFDLIEAFSKWDKKKNGLMLEESFKNDLQNYGDRFSERDTDRALEEAPVYDENGQPAIDYVEFSANLCGLQDIRKSELFQEKYSRNSKK